jgi:hypothetical protein
MWHRENEWHGLSKQALGSGLNEAINPMGWTHLIFNSRRGELNNIKLLLLAGADVSPDLSVGCSALLAIRAVICPWRHSHGHHGHPFAIGGHPFA